MDTVDTEALVADAFAQLSLPVQLVHDEPGRGIDVVVDPDDMHVEIQVKRRALVTDDDAARLVRQAQGLPADAALLVVADRVTARAGERLLQSGRAGFLDLRGRLALRAKGLILDTRVEAVVERPGRVDGLGGKVGMEVAAALLVQPDRTWAVRELARELNRAPSSVSEVLAALRAEALVTDGHAVADTRLFWRVAERWKAPRTYLDRLPRPSEARLVEPLRLGLSDVEHSVGWALTDTAAAAVYGAPVAFRSSQTYDFYVPNPVVLRRAKSLLGSAGLASQAQATVRVAPVPDAVARRVDIDTKPTRWPLAHPVFVALELAQDAGRGREILDAWSPTGRWQRVW